MRNLARELIARGSIRTTLARAKAVQPLVEKLVTKAKKGKATQKSLLADAATRFARRTSGFTRIVKLGPRAGDAAEEVLLQFVDKHDKTDKS
jgi:large subunit ribosomal protein L17